MWNRDYTLVRARVDDLQREARQGAEIAALLAATPRARREHGALRTTGAAAARWLGVHALAVAQRLDEQCTDAEQLDFGVTAAR